jgi:hypothetical protein
MLAEQATAFLKPFYELKGGFRSSFLFIPCKKAFFSAKTPFVFEKASLFVGVGIRSINLLPFDESPHHQYSKGDQANKLANQPGLVIFYVFGAFP